MFAIKFSGNRSEGKEKFYLTTHLTHFICGYIAGSII